MYNNWEELEQSNYVVQEKILYLELETKMQN